MYGRQWRLPVDEKFREASWRLALVHTVSRARSWRLKRPRRSTHRAAGHAEEHGFLETGHRAS